MNAFRFRVLALTTGVLSLLTLTTTWAEFHYCSTPVGPGGNSNHTCDTCYTDTKTYTTEPFPGYFITYPLYVTCDNTPNPGGCLRYPSLASPTTSTCNITTGACGTGVTYHLSSDCFDANVNDYVATAWSVDPDTEVCVGQKVTVTGGNATGVNCSNAEYEYVYN